MKYKITKGWMNMPRLIVISEGIETSTCIWKQLRELIGDTVDISRCSLEEGINVDFKNSLVLITSPSIKDKILPYIPLKVQYIVARRIINYKHIKKLLGIKKNSHLLLVNDSKATCTESIEQLHDMGIEHINFHPYYPEKKNYKKLDTCVTFGEGRFAPKCVKKIIDLGSRNVDISTLIEILQYFNLMDKKGSFISPQFTREIIKLTQNYYVAANKAIELKNMFKTIVDNSSDGILYINEDGTVSITNKVFCSLAGKDICHILYKKISDVIPNFTNWKVSEIQNEIIELNNKNIVITISPIKTVDNTVGYMLTTEEASKIQKIEHELRRKMRLSEHNAFYNFENIIGNSMALKNTINLAKKLALSNSTVLIQGESGTGKELFAQAIHNFSPRRNAQFVPVNFSSLSDSLLESELFGYEDGAFTGAKRGGKPGLFEQAHGGTIFLDEIGEISLQFQVKLLRILQERQIRRVGGNEIIPIDIRVIAATNKNLIKEVKKGTFRQDLFYRLSVLPLFLPSLKERKEDITCLLQHYLRKFTKKNSLELKDFFTKDSLDFLIKYSWPGNIRELVNIVEYLVNIKDPKAKIEISDLPNYIYDEVRNNNILNTNIENSLLDNDSIWILETIEKNNFIGRRGLSQIAVYENIHLTESKIRTKLNVLKSMDLVEIHKGVRGCTLTKKANLLLNKLKNGC